METGRSESVDSWLPALSAYHPQGRYDGHVGKDVVAELNRKVQEGQIHLTFEGPQGYLRSVLEELNIPIESQVMVFSKTSVQASLINPGNPRALFFNDSVAVGWVRGGFIEFAAEDPQQGTVFYVLRQAEQDKPKLLRSEMCLLCHVTSVTLGVPGMFVRSVVTASDGSAMPQMGHHFSDHRSPMEERWGGWYVTGKQIAVNHMGNRVLTDQRTTEPLLVSDAFNLKTLKGHFDSVFYLSPYSDVVALMVFDHQVHMTNLLTRMNLETRSALYGSGAERPQTVTNDSSRFVIPGLIDSAKELVDYLLFVDEAALAGPIQGSSGFAEEFATRGPFDSKGRSLRQFDLRHRLMRFPCSYMIYSPAFDALPSQAKEAVYGRLWEVLSGKAKAYKYARLTAQDQRAIVEILRDTKKDLPNYFRPLK
jgi:hypothetical protein